MSPEQAEMNAFGVDTRSDVYSLGVLLYELVTGTTPLERPRLREAALDWTADEGKTWRGPVQIDTVWGAYPSLVELPDGQVYCVYYEEGKGSGIRWVQLRVGTKGVTVEGRKE
jgi:serine/threonine protein kinase